MCYGGWEYVIVVYYVLSMYRALDLILSIYPSPRIKSTFLLIPRYLPGTLEFEAVVLKLGTTLFGGVAYQILCISQIYITIYKNKISYEVAMK